MRLSVLLSPPLIVLLSSLASTEKLVCEIGHTVGYSYYRHGQKASRSTTACFVAWRFGEDACRYTRRYDSSDAFAARLKIPGVPDMQGCWITNQTLVCLCFVNNCNNFLNWKYFLLNELNHKSVRKLQKIIAVHEEIFGKNLELVPLYAHDQIKERLACVLKRYLETEMDPPTLETLPHFSEIPIWYHWEIVIPGLLLMLIIKVLAACYYYHLWKKYRSRTYPILNS
ncbi:hypothetical protein RB195_003465 [Necator americanus]|uniref:Uncharacterized protein n=1 Tax=Necator americanus TaxID=51031 RepID=A0ABR1DQ10_NECAM